MIAVLLALVAAVLLAVGYLADVPLLGWAALVVSLGVLVLLLLPVFARGPEVAAPAVQDEAEPTPEPAAEPAREPVDDSEIAPEPDLEPDEAPESGDDVVLVIAGRHRFHRPGCELIADREVEKLTEDEAREEGFSACTRCMR